MKIPKEFKLLGSTIKIKYQKNLTQFDNALGTASYRTNEIYIQSNEVGYPRTKEQLEQTFLHELIHHILNAMKRKELNDDEKFVDMFASLLHQYEQTKK